MLCEALTNCFKTHLAQYLAAENDVGQLHNLEVNTNEI